MQHPCLYVPHRPLTTTTPSMSQVLTVMNLSTFQMHIIPLDLSIEFCFIKISRPPNFSARFHSQILIFCLLNTTKIKLMFPNQRNNFLSFYRTPHPLILYERTFIGNTLCLSPQTAECSLLLSDPFLTIL